MKRRLIGIIVPCISCQERFAKWLVLGFPLCDACASRDGNSVPADK